MLRNASQRNGSSVNVTEIVVELGHSVPALQAARERAVRRTYSAHFERWVAMFDDDVDGNLDVSEFMSSVQLPSDTMIAARDTAIR